MGSIESLLVVIVLYRKKIADSESFQSLQDILLSMNLSVDLAIYDNSEHEQETLRDERIRLHYYHDPSNPGISRSYNRASQLAKVLGKKWLLFFDQDTRLTVDTLTIYLESMDDKNPYSICVPTLLLENKEVFSPCKFVLKRGKMLKAKLPAGYYHFNSYSFVNSGLLINQTVFEQAGGYNENVKLDYADFEFIERLKNVQAGFNLLDVSLDHSFSDVSNDLESTQKRFLQFLSDLRYCSRNNSIDHLLFLRVVCIRAFKLAIKFKSVYFLRKLVSVYLMPNVSK